MSEFISDVSEHKIFLLCSSQVTFMPKNSKLFLPLLSSTCSIGLASKHCKCRRLRLLKSFLRIPIVSAPWPYSNCFKAAVIQNHMFGLIYTLRAASNLSSFLPSFSDAGTTISSAQLLLHQFGFLSTVWFP